MNDNFESLDELFGLISEDSNQVYNTIEGTPGAHVALLAAQVIQVMEMNQSELVTSKKDVMAQWRAITQIVRSDYLNNEVTDKIRERYRDLSLRNPTLMRAFLGRQASISPDLQKLSPFAVSLEGVKQPLDLNDKGGYIVPEGYEPEGLDDYPEVAEILRNEPTLNGVLKALDLLVEEQDAHDVVLLPGLPSEGGTGTTNYPVAFQSPEEELKAALLSIFDSVGKLEGAPYDALFIEDEMDMAVNRCIGSAYEYTNNSVKRVDGYLTVLEGFQDDINPYKQQLYKRLTEIFGYVKGYEVSSLGLNEEKVYPHFRLSQIIPSWFLKNRKYVMDTSACSSGKTGTILKAPADVNAKRTVVVVENNTYTDIYKMFVSWYSTRKDYQVIHKDNFWKDTWMDSKKNIICVLDKAFLARVNEQERVLRGLESFDSYIKRSGLDLLVVDEVHNYKGANSGGTLRVADKRDSEEEERDDSHNNCSRAIHLMSVVAEYRLFSSATPVMNDFTELAKVLQMLLPTTDTKDKNHRYQSSLREVQDDAKSVTDIMGKASALYAPLQIVSTSVPKPGIEYDITEVSNKGIGITDGYLSPSMDWKDEWTKQMGELVREMEERSYEMTGSRFYWSDVAQDEIHFGGYLLLMREQIVRALAEGHQICFYTNQSRQKHELMKELVLELVEGTGVELDESEVVIANGTTSSRLRKPVEIQLDDGSTTEKTLLASRVWDKSCRVLLANNVISVGLDGLQGTDKIEGCGRISRVFLMANPFTDAIRYQLYSRFVRTQGESNTYPEVKFYQPHIWWDASPEGEEEIDYSRNQSTNGRLALKRLKADLVVDGVFPEELKIEELTREMSDCVIKQFASGTFFTEEGEMQRLEMQEELMSQVEVD